MHSTVIFLERIGAKQGCRNGHSSITPNKVYYNAPFVTVIGAASEGVFCLHLWHHIFVGHSQHGTAFTV